MGIHASLREAGVAANGAERQTRPWYNPPMSIRYPHRFFLQWLAVVSAVLFGFYLAWDLGAVAALLEYDKSRISPLIIAIFFVTTVGAGFRVVYLSREIDRAEYILGGLRRHRGQLRLDESGRVSMGGEVLPACLLHEQLYKQLTKRQRGGGNSGMLLERMEKDLVAKNEFGWFIADIMIKLGLLGTVIGFIFMLGSVATIENADITTIQNMLVGMSSGMRVALFTTLSGLLGGMLLGLQCFFIDRGAERLASLVSDAVETYLS